MIKKIYFDDFEEREYPFNVEALQNTKELGIDPKITIFVGDNGSGKSTLLKAKEIGYKAGLERIYLGNI